MLTRLVCMKVGLRLKRYRNTTPEGDPQASEDGPNASIYDIENEESLVGARQDRWGGASGPKKVQMFKWL